MSDIDKLDLSALRRMWDERRGAMRPILARMNPQGLSRPARDPDERARLDARDEGVFVEGEAMAAAAREYCGRKYRR